MTIFRNEAEKQQFRDMVIQLLDKALDNPKHQNMINMTQSRPHRRIEGGDGMDTFESLGVTVTELTLIIVDK